MKGSRRRPARRLAAVVLAIAAAVPGAAPAAAAEAPVGGRVVGADGTPIAGARVALYEPLAPWRRMAGELAGDEPTPRTVARTDADGRFAFAAPAGLWQLEVTAPGRWPHRTELALDGQPLESGPLGLSPAADVDVRVVDAAGRPVAGARAALVSAGADRHLPGAAATAWRTTADADGRTQLPRPRHAALLVGAVAPGFAPGRMAVEPGRDPGSLRLEPGVEWTVEVRDRLRSPVAGAVISTADTGLPLATTGDDGLAGVRLPAGERARLVVHSAAGSALALVEPPRRSPSADEGTAPRRLIVTVAPEGELAGRVLAAPGRLPLAGAYVWVRWRPDLAATTDDRGVFRLPLDPHAAIETETFVVAAAAGHRQAWQRTDTAAGETMLVLEPLAALSGRVVDGDGEPVPGARLVASSWDPWRPGRGPAVERAVSAGDGRFRLVRLEPEALHRLVVAHPDHAVAELDVTAPPAGGARPEVEVVLDRGARAYGVVFGADGAPLAGATAALRPVQPEGPPFRPRLGFEERSEPSTASDGEGRFVFDHVVPGRFDLHLSAPGHAPLVVPGVEVPPPPEPGDLGSISLQRGAEIAGRVTDADGAPLAGVEVHAMEHEAPMRGGGGGDDPAATTGADGRFAVRDLAPGSRLDLTLAAAGFVAELVVGVVAPPERPLEIVLERAATVTGRVVDGFGAAIADAWVNAERDQEPRRRILRRGPSSHATTDAEGGFVLTGVPSGAVRVAAQAEDFQPGEPLLLELAAGERHEGVRLELRRGGTLAGRVTGPDGEPVPDVAVQASASQRGFGGPRAQTDQEGRYRITGLAAGVVQVRAEHPDYVAPVREATIGAGETRLDLELERGIEVSGRVLDDAGAPVAGAEVSLVADPWRGFRQTAPTAEDGSFRLRGVEPGTWRLAVAAEGLAQVDPDTRYEIAATRSGIEMRMTAGAAIVGRVRGLELDELARLRLSAHSDARAGRPRSGSADYQGAYRIDGVSPGEWRVLAVLGEAEAMASGEVELAAGQSEARLDLDFAGELVLSGRVTLGGEPVAGADVGLVGPAGFARGATAGDGSFRIGHLTAGSYVLNVQAAPEGLAHRQEVDLHGDREVRIDLEATEVAGRVTDAETGLPVAGARVELAPDRGGPVGFGSETRSGDPDGAFRLRRVAPGEYLLRVGKDGYATASRPLDVEGAAGVAGLEVALTPAAGAVVEVTSADGAPPWQVWLAVIDAAAPPDTPPVAVASGVFTPGEAGRVHVDSLPPGRWRVLVHEPGRAVAAVELTAPGPPVRAVLAPEAILDVTVRPLAETSDARMRLLGPDGRPFLVPSFVPTPQGEWPLVGGHWRLGNVPAGTWTLEVTAGDGRAWTRPVTAVAGATTEVVVE